MMKKVCFVAVGCCVMSSYAMQEPKPSHWLQKTKVLHKTTVIVELQNNNGWQYRGLKTDEIGQVHFFITDSNGSKKNIIIKAKEGTYSCVNVLAHNTDTPIRLYTVGHVVKINDKPYECRLEVPFTQESMRHGKQYQVLKPVFFRIDPTGNMAMACSKYFNIKTKAYEFIWYICTLQKLDAYENKNLLLLRRLQKFVGPNVDAIAAATLIGDSMFFLLKQGEIVMISPDSIFVIDQQAYDAFADVKFICAE